MTSETNTSSYVTLEGRENQFLADMQELVSYHLERCLPYANILRARGYENHSLTSLADLPYLSTRLFKKTWLTSANPGQPLTVYTSSGTTSQARSRIGLDASSIQVQRFHLVGQLVHLFGRERRPMLVLDVPHRADDLRSAGRAASLGALLVSKTHHYALDRDGKLSVANILNFVDAANDAPSLIIASTGDAWRFHSRFGQVAQQLLRRLSRPSTLIHTGGWKLAINEAVPRAQFGASMRRSLNVNKIVNYYGMVEALGTIFPDEDETGVFHCPPTARVLCRRLSDLSVAAPGEPGLIQILSTLRQSYPGCSLLTDDIGTLIQDDKQGTVPGSSFRVYERVHSSEPRGCSWLGDQE